LAASTTKKVLLRRFDRETLHGYVNPGSFLQPGGVELLSAEGNVSLVPYLEIKAIAFVREFDAPAGPERRAFQTRPRTAGLWVSLRFRDGETLEGVMPNNLLQLEQSGFTIIPPDSSSNQRIFAPRAALVEVEVLGVIGSPLHRRKPKPAAKEQTQLFEEGSRANE
jgi:Family of unknown function (DUF6982)